MKALNSSLKLAAAALLMLFVAVACGSGTPSAESVAQKINAGESLSEADYTSMIDYCGEYAKKAQPFFDIINSQSSDTTAEAVKATSDMAELYAQYRYLDTFRTALYAVQDNQLSEGNMKKVNDFAQYEAFPLPGGEADYLLNPQVVGMIEQTPVSGETTDTTGVIATGAGEAINENMK